MCGRKIWDNYWDLAIGTREKKVLHWYSALGCLEGYLLHSNLRKVEFKKEYENMCFMWENKNVSKRKKRGQSIILIKVRKKGNISCMSTYV